MSCLVFYFFTYIIYFACLQHIAWNGELLIGIGLDWELLFGCFDSIWIGFLDLVFGIWYLVFGSTAFLRLARLLGLLDWVGSLSRFVSSRSMLLQY